MKKQPATPETDSLPTTIWSGSFHLFGVEVKCHTLDNGLRIIEAESMEHLLEAMQAPTTIDAADIERFTRWQTGR